MITTVKWIGIATSAALAVAGGTAAAQAQSAEEMSFFISSVGSGDGANFGGLEGADAHCTALAQAAGSSKTWAAYLSTSMVIDRSSGSPQITDFDTCTVNLKSSVSYEQRRFDLAERIVVVIVGLEVDSDGG